VVVVVVVIVVIGMAGHDVGWDGMGWSERIVMVLRFGI